MQVIDDDEVCFVQSMYQDNFSLALPALLKRCPGVDKIIVVKRPISNSETTYTYLFKGRHKSVVRETWARTYI